MRDDIGHIGLIYVSIHMKQNQENWFDSSDIDRT